MTRLTLLRHGQAADPSTFEGDDDQRPLTSAGRRRTRECARGLRRLGVKPDAILSSPLVRARETAELAARGLRLDPGSIQIAEALRPEASPEDLLETLRTDLDEVLVVGHAPHLDRLLGFLVARGQVISQLKKSGAARVDLAEESSEGEEPMGTLAWLLGPGALERIAR